MLQRQVATFLLLDQQRTTSRLLALASTLLFPVLQLSQGHQTGVLTCYHRLKLILYAANFISVLRLHLPYLLFMLLYHPSNLLFVGANHLVNLLLNGHIPAILISLFVLVKLLSPRFLLLELSLLDIQLTPHLAVALLDLLEILIFLMNLNIQLLLKVFPVLIAFLLILPLKNNLLLRYLILYLQYIIFSLLNHPVSLI